jgi:para-aminobenzoate synthetase component 1
VLTVLDTYVSPYQVAQAWPADQALLFFAGRGRFAILVTSAVEIGASEALARPLVLDPKTQDADSASDFSAEFPFLGGIVGLLSYDDYTSDVQGVLPSRFFRVDTALLFDQQKQILAFSERASQSSERETLRSIIDLEYSEVEAILKAARNENLKDSKSQAPLMRLVLTSQETDTCYLQKVANILDDIRSGRFYQINLLRYFKLTRTPDRRELLTRLWSKGGNYSVLFDLPDLRLASFSPERFIHVQQMIINTYPVKGTVARPRVAIGGEAADREAARWLYASEKDQAELHMIVDLMRNDLNKISETGTVQVKDAGRIVTHPTVHHLEARIEARLQPGLILGQFLRAVCPGGSITGAPKKEVMKAIRSYEGRDRGYFMGNVFYLDDRGNFDSSILIRTVVNGEFAAGSGLVIRSDPQLEMQEIATKCRVLEV